MNDLAKYLLLVSLSHGFPRLYEQCEHVEADLALVVRGCVLRQVFSVPKPQAVILFKV